MNSFDGHVFYGTARLNKDGLIDSQFKPVTYATSFNIFFTPDNKIILSGYGGIARFNDDGTPDYDFPTFPMGWVQRLFLNNYLTGLFWQRL